MIFKFTLRDIFFFLFAFACLCGAAFNKFADERRITELSLEVSIKKTAADSATQENEKRKTAIHALEHEITRAIKKADEWEGRFYNLQTSDRHEHKQLDNLIRFTDRHLRTMYVPDEVCETFNAAAFDYMGIRPYKKLSDFSRDTSKPQPPTPTGFLYNGGDD